MYVLAGGDWPTDTCEKYNVPFTNVGKIAIADVGEFLSSLDILVLPSLTTDDGWGVVVSEALMVGTSVIVSSKAGASLVLQDPLLGKRVKPNCSASIAEAIDEIVASKELTHERRELRRKVAVKLLSAESGAAFFLKAVAHATTRSDTTPHPDWPDLSSILSDVEKNQIFGVSAPVEASFE
jgi:glycosyltransferase involved in cell wall biosynthesis